MDSQNIIELCRDSNETDNQVKLDQWLVAQDSLLEYFEEIEEEGAFPDLYGKSVLVSESQFPNVFNIVNITSVIGTIINFDITVFS